MAITLSSSDNSGQLLTAIKGCPVRYTFTTDSYFEPVLTRFYYEIGSITVADLVASVEREYHVGAYRFKYTETLSSPKTDIIFTAGMSLADLASSTLNTLEGLMRADYSVAVELREGDTELWILIQAKCTGVAGATRIRQYDKSSNTTTVLRNYATTNVEGVGGVRSGYEVKLQVYINDIYQYDMYLLPQGSMCYTSNTDSVPMCIDVRNLLENQVYTTFPDFSSNFDILPSENSIKEFSWSAYDVWDRYDGESEDGLCDAWSALGDSYINAPLVSSSSLITIEYWVHLQGNGNQGVIGVLTGSEGIEYVGGAPVVHAGGGNSVTFPAIDTNVWVHQSFTINLASTSNNISYYENGILISTTSVTVPSTLFRIDLVGTYNLGSVLTGYMAEVRVFDDIRSTPEVEENYDKEVSVLDPDLLLYYQFKESNTSTVSNNATGGSDAVHRELSSASPIEYTKTVGPTCYTTSYTEQGSSIEGISTPQRFINALCEDGSSDMSAYGFIDSGTLVKPLLILPEDGIIDICHGQPEIIYFYIPEEFNLLFPQLRLVDSANNVLGSDTFSFLETSHFNNIHYVNLTEALNGLSIGDTATLEWTNTGVYGQYMELVHYHKLSSSTDECCCSGSLIFLNSKGGFQAFPTSCVREYGIEIDGSTFCVCEGCSNNETVGQRYTNLTWSKRKRVFSRNMPVNEYTKQLITDFFKSGDIRWYEDGKALPIRFNQNTRVIQSNKNTIQFDMTFNVAKTFTSLINNV